MMMVAADLLILFRFSRARFHGLFGVEGGRFGGILGLHGGFFVSLFVLSRYGL